MLYQRLEILIKASRSDAIEFIEGVNTDLELEYYKLLKTGHILEVDKPFNSQSFSDSHGRLHKFKYVQITAQGLELFKEMIKEVKKRKAAGQDVRS